MINQTITAHCLVKNEENFIRHAIKSVVDFVEKIIIFDTGSTDKTIEIIDRLKQEYPNKIIFEKKSECDKKRHTELRNEMIQSTNTDWFMVLDGDEVWSKRGMLEVKEKINSKDVECLIVPFYLCVGDIFHYSWRGKFGINGKKIHATSRIFENKNVKWIGEYGVDCVINKKGKKIYEDEKFIILKNKYWHLTHLERSSIESDYSSGGIRKDKKRLTYFLIGKKIKEKVPEVFLNGKKDFKLRFFKSFINFFIIAKNKILYAFNGK